MLSGLIRAVRAEAWLLGMYRVARLVRRSHAGGKSGVRSGRKLERALALTSPDEPMILEWSSRAYTSSRWRHAELVRVLVADRGAHRGYNDQSASAFLSSHCADPRRQGCNDEAHAVEWYERALDAERGYVPAIIGFGLLYTRRKRSGKSWSECTAARPKLRTDPLRRAAASRAHGLKSIETRAEERGTGRAASTRALSSASCRATRLRLKALCPGCDTQAAALRGAGRSLVRTRGGWRG